MKYVVTYQSSENVAAKAPPFFAAHVAHYQEYVKAGTLLMLGTFEHPQEDGSMCIFTTREAAEEFVRGDPFVINGVVRNWTIRGWNEVLFGVVA